METMTVERGMRWHDCSAFFGFISVRVFYELLLTIYVFLANEIVDKNIKYDRTKLPKKMFGKTDTIKQKVTRRKEELGHPVEN